MIEYEHGTWGCLFAFQLRGSAIPRALAWALTCATLASGFHVLLENSDGPWVTALADISGDVLRGFTFVLGFLIVFRTQKAYSRWWEGGTLLQQLRGEWFNAVSNLIAFCNNAPEKRAEVERFQHQVVRLFSLLYGSALTQVSTMTDKTFEFIDLDGFDKHHMEFLGETHDECELVVQWLQRLIVEANTHDLVKIAPPILSRVYNQLGNGIVKLNNARKIKEFPIPFPLAQMITFMLFIHWLTTAMVCALTLSSPYMAALASFVIIVSFHGINYMAVELENPYGDDPNDLPLLDMQRDMNRSLQSLLHRKALVPPSFEWHPEEGRKMITSMFSVEDYVKDLRAYIAKAPVQESMEPGGDRQQELADISALEAELEELKAHVLSPSTEPQMIEVDNCLDGVCDEGGAMIGSSQDSSYGDKQFVRGHDAGGAIVQYGSPEGQTDRHVRFSPNVPQTISAKLRDAAALRSAPRPADAARG
eukprot:TRINITY_DN65371_c0_g1_i1.p1 TRINITY_DN65371_c0_g1~~TRINITY_DN65371_c0_g1_i1.p1  ORF type:complete len:492 (-),score=36.87 TRINITY_DN65371_c0_g1_i1:159-1589(-)